MPIAKLEFPSLGLDVLTNTLSDLADSGDALGGALDQEISDPLPVYSLTLLNAAEEELPKRDEPVSWRYLLFRPTGISAADINSTGDASQAGQFNSITEGKIIDGLYDALLFVDKKFSDSDEEYEIRILEIPSLNEAAIWLRSEDGSIFIPYLDADRLQGSPPAVKDDFLQNAAELAQRRLGDPLR